MTDFKRSLIIGEIEYEFIANRNAKLLQEGVYAKVFANRGNEDMSSEQMKVTFIYGLLQGKFSMADCKELYVLATTEDEYGDRFDLFLGKMQEHTVVVGKKTLDFLDDM